MGWVSNNPCQGKDFRANRQRCPFGSIQVDLKMHLVLFNREVDDAATFGEPFGLPDREDIGTFQAVDNACHLSGFRCSHKNHMASSQVRSSLDPLDHYRMFINRSAAKILLMVRIKGILPGDAHHEGRIGLREGVGGPLDELCKIIEKCKLDAVLGIVLALGTNEWGRRQDEPPGSQEQHPAANEASAGRGEKTATPPSCRIAWPLPAGLHGRLEVVSDFHSEIPAILIDHVLPVLLPGRVAIALVKNVVDAHRNLPSPRGLPAEERETGHDVGSGIIPLHGSSSADVGKVHAGEELFVKKRYT